MVQYRTMKTGMLTFLFELDLLGFVENYATRYRMSKSQVIRLALLEYQERHEHELTFQSSEKEKRDVGEIRAQKI